MTTDRRPRQSLNAAVRTVNLQEGDEVIYRHWVWEVLDVRRNPMDNGLDVKIQRTAVGYTYPTETTTVSFSDFGPYGEQTKQF